MNEEMLVLLWQQGEDGREDWGNISKFLMGFFWICIPDDVEVLNEARLLSAIAFRRGEMWQALCDRVEGRVA